MNNRDDFPIWMSLLLAIFAFLIGVVVGSVWAVSEQHQVAIKHGAAEWTVDPQTGITTFHWKDKP